MATKRNEMPMNYMLQVEAFNLWGIDFMGLFPSSRGKQYILVVVDYVTKWVEAQPLATITARKMTEFIQKHILCRYGIPRIIVSDNGLQFMAKEFQEWCADRGIQNKFASVSHPQSNGQVEVTNRTIVEGIKKKLEGAQGN